LHALNDNTYNEVRLGQDILDYSGGSYCINDPENFNNKIFDCQGHVIDGVGGNFGIYLSGKTGNTIRNCIITEFSNGIFLYSSSNNITRNNTAKDSAKGDFYSYGSLNNVVINLDIGSAIVSFESKDIALKKALSPGGEP
jgi:parallel beta-helix repeat protein